MGRLRRYQCGACEHRYHLFEWRGELLSQDRLDDAENISCPECESNSRREVASDIGRLSHKEGESKHFPHYNRGLGHGPDGRGVLVRSEAHLRQLCKEQNVVPWSEVADGEDFDIRANAEKRAHREREGAKRYRAMIERYKTDPELKEAYFKLEERGAYRPLRGK